MPHDPQDGLHQLALLEGLEQVGGDPQLTRPGQVAGAVSRGQQDDPRRGQLLPLANLGGQGQAVDVRHSAVKKHERVGMALRHAVPESVHGRHAVAGGRRLHLVAAQPLLEDAAVGRIVIDDQHRQPAERKWRHGGESIRRGLPDGGSGP